MQLQLGRGFATIAPTFAQLLNELVRKGTEPDGCLREVLRGLPTLTGWRHMCVCPLRCKLHNLPLEVILHWPVDISLAHG